MISNHNMKYIAAKVIHSAYGRSQGIVLFGQNKTSKRDIKCHRFAHEKKSKK